jgi:hypothetical protein
MGSAGLSRKIDSKEGEVTLERKIRGLLRYKYFALYSGHSLDTTRRLEAIPGRLYRNLGYPISAPQKMQHTRALHLLRARFTERCQFTTIKTVWWNAEGWGGYALWRMAPWLSDLPEKVNRH